MEHKFHSGIDEGVEHIVGALYREALYVYSCIKNYNVYLAETMWYLIEMCDNILKSDLKE